MVPMGNLASRYQTSLHTTKFRCTLSNFAANYQTSLHSIKPCCTLSKLAVHYHFWKFFWDFWILKSPAHNKKRKKEFFPVSVPPTSDKIRQQTFFSWVKIYEDLLGLFRGCTKLLPTLLTYIGHRHSSQSILNHF